METWGAADTIVGSGRGGQAIRMPKLASGPPGTLAVHSGRGLERAVKCPVGRDGMDLRYMPWRANALFVFLGLLQLSLFLWIQQGLLLRFFFAFILTSLITHLTISAWF